MTIGINKALIGLILIALGTIHLQSNNYLTIDQFQAWKIQHQIQYKDEQQNQYRKNIFYQTKTKIMMHNLNPTHTYKMGLNQFSALTHQQFAQLHLQNLNVQNPLIVHVQETQNVKATDIDWTQQGAVGPTKNQGNCAAAWVFATTGPLQGLSKISTGVLQILSDQQLVDCANPTGGCHGGFADTGFKYVKQHGICTAQQYPWNGTLQKCLKPDGSFKISGYSTINNCNDLSTAIHKGPVSVTVDATNWMTYRSGILSNCGTSLNHVATLVGQVQDNWKIQNSWGTAWGQNGYIRLAKGNTCGICISGILPLK